MSLKKLEECDGRAAGTLAPTVEGTSRKVERKASQCQQSGASVPTKRKKFRRLGVGQRRPRVNCVVNEEKEIQISKSVTKSYVCL